MQRDVPPPAPPTADWLIAVRAGAVLAAAIGVGRFVFTPILPLMAAQAGLTAQAASLVATANYVGYFLGAVLGIIAPRLGTSRASMRVSGVILLLTLPAMTISDEVAIWCAVRLVAGIASALVFVVAGNAILTQLARAHPQFIGWAYGGLGVGIALSGAVVAVVGDVSNWRAAWWASAALAAVLIVIAWPIGGATSAVGSAFEVRLAESTATPGRDIGRVRGSRRQFVLLFASYTLEGTGYIIVGTFLVAAVHAVDDGPLSQSVWAIVGLAVIPSCAVWMSLAARYARSTLLTTALALQAIGIALPAFVAYPWAGAVGAVLFGTTFMGITTLAMAEGRALGSPRAVSLLTAGYSGGQIAGPLVAVPLLVDGYRGTLLLGTAVVAMAAIASAAMRCGRVHGRA